MCEMDHVFWPMQDIGDGWWEGELENGESGLFPESYVEVILHVHVYYVQ